MKSKQSTHSLHLVQKRRSLGVVMDPIGHIDPKKDTTIAILMEAQRRGCLIFYMEQTDIFLRNSLPFARMRLLHLGDRDKAWFSLDQGEVRELASLDVILMRKDPPVDMSYIRTTQLLDMAEARGVRIFNKPQSLRDYNEKLFTLHFPQCCPPTLVTSSIEAAKRFLEEHEDIIVKPLHGMSGFSVFRISRFHDPNVNVILETVSDNNQRHMVLQRYIPEVTQGDKRILMIVGKPVPYALARIAAPGETRANLARGAKGIGIPLSEHDRWICHQIGPSLYEKGLYFVGLDVIGEYLTEINITSPTGIRELDAQFELNIAGTLMDAILNDA